MRKTNYLHAAVIAAVFGMLLGPRSPILRPAKAGPPQGAQVPKFEVDPSWPKPLPELWVTDR